MLYYWRHSGLYERDFYREFTSYMNNQSGHHDRLTDVLDVLNRTRLRIEDIPAALDVRQTPRHHSHIPLRSNIRVLYIHFIAFMQ